MKDNTSKIKCFKEEPSDDLYCRFMFTPNNQSQQLYLANIPNDEFLDLYADRIKIECDATLIHYNNSIYSHDDFWVKVNAENGLFRSNYTIKDSSFEHCINHAMDKENEIWIKNLHDQFYLNIAMLFVEFVGAFALLGCAIVLAFIIKYSCEGSCKNNAKPNEKTHLLNDKPKNDNQGSGGCFNKLSKSVNSFFACSKNGNNEHIPAKLGLV